LLAGDTVATTPLIITTTALHVTATSVIVIPRLSIFDCSTHASAVD
jgi:hypothetical protein